MKSFSEYIKESYSFRLGGSQQKGFDQNKIKTITQLEKGDIFYWFYRDFQGHASHDKAFKRKVNYITVDEFNKKLTISFSYSGRTESCLLKELDDFDITFYERSNDIGLWCATTDEDLFIETLNSKYDANLTSEDIIDQTK